MGFFDRFKSKLERDLAERRAKKVKPSGASPAPEATRPPTEKGSTIGGHSSKTTLAHRTLAYPLVTEKSAALAERGTYVFVVPPQATKIEVKQAVYEVYGVRPAHVRVIRRQGKRVRFGRSEGRRKEWKKAMVTMPPGKTLPIYE